MMQSGSGSHRGWKFRIECRRGESDGSKQEDKEKFHVWYTTEPPSGFNYAGPITHPEIYGEPSIFEEHFASDVEAHTFATEHAKRQIDEIIETTTSSN